MWGYVVAYVNDGIMVDSLSHRLLIVLPFLAVVLYNHFSKKFSIEYITYIGIFFLTADYCYLIAINNRVIHTTGLYVVLTASLAVINKKWFLWFYALSFAIYCLFSILFVSQNLLETTHWGNMMTLILLMTFFGLWRIKILEQLDTEYKSNLEKSKQLEELNNIAAQAAHDIRSPVMALEAFAKTMTQVDSSKLKIISDTAQRVSGIADNLVAQYKKNFSSSEENTVSKDIFDIQSVQEIIESLKEEKLILQSDFRKYKILVHGNISYKIKDSNIQFELKRVISNLINNSIEAFNDSNGKIDLILNESQDDFIIQIKDNGHGIPKALQEKVFDRGISLKNSGSGLGLFHAKETVEKFRGKIDLSSKEGLGTLVQITIPKS